MKRVGKGLKRMEKGVRENGGKGLKKGRERKGKWYKRFKRYKRCKRYKS